MASRPSSSSRPGKPERYCEARAAAEYDLRWAGRAGARRNRRKATALEAGMAALEAAAGRRLQSALDVPCGTGRFLSLLQDRGLRCLGGDLAPAMLAEARRKRPQALLVAADLARLPFPDGAFDAAVCVRFLHLVREPGQRVACLKELRRVARVGVVVDYRHSRSLRVLGRRLRHRLGWLPRAPANPSPAGIRREMEAAGLRISGWIPVHKAPWMSDKVVVAGCRV